MVKVSYLVSTYDSAQYLDRHIANLIEYQTDPDFEIVVVNPDSPGGDGFIAQKWAAIDSRINYIYWPRREWYGESWLRAWMNAKGEFVMNSNTDDYHSPDSTAVVYDYFSKQSSDVAFCYGGLTVIDEQNKILGQGLKPPFDRDIMSYECWAGPGVAWRNDDKFKRSLNWDLMWKRAAEYRSAFDYWLWLYFMSLGFSGSVINEVITIYTQRSNSIENSNKWMNNWETYSAISEFFPHHFQNRLKHAKEFADFNNRPPREEWIATMQRGDKWKC
jgi:hypothetical protein